MDFVRAVDFDLILNVWWISVFKRNVFEVGCYTGAAATRSYIASAKFVACCLRNVVLYKKI